MGSRTFIEFKREEIEQSIPDRFEQQVKKYPQNIAVKTKNDEWTYQALNRAANRIAQTILTLGGREEERIALLFEHGAPMIAGILGAAFAIKLYWTRLKHFISSSRYSRKKIEDERPDSENERD